MSSQVGGLPCREDLVAPLGRIGVEDFTVLDHVGMIVILNHIDAIEVPMKKILRKNRLIR